jgi:hypothetical protein
LGDRERREIHMTLAQAARELDMREDSVRALCVEKVLHARKEGRGQGWNIPRREVARLKRNLARRQMIPVEDSQKKA